MSDAKKAVRAGDTKFPARYAKRQKSILDTFHAQAEDTEQAITRYQKGVDSGRIKPIPGDKSNGLKNFARKTKLGAKAMSNAG